MKNRFSFLAFGFELFSRAVVAQQTPIFEPSDASEASWQELMTEGAKLRDQAQLPRVMNVDKNPVYPAAVEALKADGTIPRRVVLRQCKYQ